MKILTSQPITVKDKGSYRNPCLATGAPTNESRDVSAVKTCFTMFLILFVTAAAMAVVPDRICRAGSREAILENGIRDFQEKRFENAVHWFTQLIELEPFSAKAYKNRAAAYMELGRLDEAIRDLTSALNLEPELQGLNNNLGVAWYSKKEYAKAIECYSREIELNPDRFSAYFNRAMAFSDSGSPGKALEDLAEVMKLVPGNYMALCYMGDVEEKTGRREAAARTFARVLELDPQNRYALTRLKELGEASQASPPPEPGPTRDAFTVQAGAFRTRENALGLAERLKTAGYDARVVELPDSRGAPWFLVRLGTFTDRRSAQALTRELKETKGLATVICHAGTL